jgi:hypothetical protein
VLSEFLEKAVYMCLTIHLVHPPAYSYAPSYVIPSGTSCDMFSTLSARLGSGGSLVAVTLLVVVVCSYLYLGWNRRKKVSLSR